MRFADSTDRCPADYLKFGIGFVGFMFAIGGIVFGAAWSAILGAIIFFAVLFTFFFSRDSHCEY
jgi:hypothetical protein